MSLDLEASHPPVPGGYVRPTWRQAVAELVPVDRRRPWMERWVPWLPTVLVLAVYALLVAAARQHRNGRGGARHQRRP